MTDLSVKEWTSVDYISGPLLIVKNAKELSYGALVEIETETGIKRSGQVLEVQKNLLSFKFLKERLDLMLKHAK